MNRTLLCFLAAALLLVVSPVAAVELRPDRPELRQGGRPLAELVGETLVYDIAFLWFEGVAEGRLSLEAGELPGTYRAVLEARTLGVAAWLTGDRMQRYVSQMALGEDGRLHSLSFESHIIKGKPGERSDTTRRYIFDGKRRQIRYQRARNGQFYRDELLPMAASVTPVDVLTAFYNFRAGLVGSVTAGSRTVIPTFNRKGRQEILVEVLAPAQRPREAFFPADGLLCRVTVDGEVLDSKGGVVYVLFDDFGRPERGIVENVIGLGNVRGRMRR
jgi:hypothetical protein